MGQKPALCRRLMQFQRCHRCRPFRGVAAALSVLGAWKGCSRDGGAGTLNDVCWKDDASLYSISTGISTHFRARGKAAKVSVPVAVSLATCRRVNCSPLRLEGAQL